MRSKFRLLRPYRPRLMTLAAFFGIASLLVLANMSDVMTRRDTALAGFDLRELHTREELALEGSPGALGLRGVWNFSYGWPLLWNQYACDISPPLPKGVSGWYYSPSRLAANAVLWLVMTTVPALACEKLLRRSPLCLRWRLRTMLATVALAAAFCAWFAAARIRTKVQDSIIASGSQVWVDRRGPRWLEVIGADRFFQRIVAAKVLTSRNDAEESRQEELLRRLQGLSNLRYLIVEGNPLTPGQGAAIGDLRELQMLSIRVGQFTPDIAKSLAAALRDKSNLRVLSVELDNWLADEDEEKQVWHECLAAIGKLNHLESLRLRAGTLRSESLSCLAELTNLRSISIEVYGVVEETEGPSSEWPLGNLPRLPRLESLKLVLSNVTDPDLQCLSTLPRLRSLNLCLRLSPVGVAKLAAIQNLEQLTISDEIGSPDALDALRSAKRLKVLKLCGFGHFDGDIELDDGSRMPIPEGEVANFRRATDDLRRAIPGIRIESCNAELIAEWPDPRIVSAKYEPIPGVRWWAHQFLHIYKTGKHPGGSK